MKRYADTPAIGNNEPGIYHSYMRSLATAINYINGELDPVWLMGSTAFAFRIFVNETMCPSAMSMFSFERILPEALEQAGYNCIYVQRMWDENDKEGIMRREAHTNIVAGINRGVPAIAWDLHEAEWGLIIGFDDEREQYFIFTHDGLESFLPYNKLGRNGIDILSVAIPGNPNLRKREEIIINSLKTAVAHAMGKEWIDDRPEYQDGLAAFDLWASIFEKWAWIIDAGKSDNIGLDIFGFSRYYAGHYYSARCYARDWLNDIAEGNQHLQKAALAYGQVADLLKPLWVYFSNEQKPESQQLKTFAEMIKDAKHLEGEGIELIKQHIKQLKK
nr:hypothetical protein [Bacteroidota bacterium]